MKAEGAWLYLLDRYVGPLEGKRVLDVGCGAGKLVAGLFEHGARPVGADIVAPAGFTLPYIQADAAELPFVSESFDIVVSIGALEHVVRPYEAVAEMARVLKPDGLLLLYFGPNRRLRFAQSRSHRKSVKAYWTPEEAEACLRTSGITSILRVWARTVAFRGRTNTFTFGRGFYGRLIRLGIGVIRGLRLWPVVYQGCRMLESAGLQRNIGIVGVKG